MDTLPLAQRPQAGAINALTRGSERSNHAVGIDTFPLTYPDFKPRLSALACYAASGVNFRLRRTGAPRGTASGSRPTTPRARPPGRIPTN